LEVRKDDPLFFFIASCKQSCLPRQARDKHGGKTATDKKRTDFADNTHGLMAMVGAVGECQLHFPELVHTVRPWQSVMDKAAFI
jgi:hypothetical protein